MGAARKINPDADRGGENAQRGAASPDARPKLVVVGETEAAAALLRDDRREVLEALPADGGSASSVARSIGAPRQKVNYHLRELERVGLVEQIGERRKGNCIERIVRARASTFALDPKVLGALGTDDRASDQDRRSASYIVSIACRTIREIAELMRRAGDARKKLSTLTIDSEVRFKDQSSQRAFGEELAQSIASLCAQYHADDAASGRTFRVVAHTYQAITKPDPSGSDATARTNPSPAEGDRS